MRTSQYDVSPLAGQHRPPAHAEQRRTAGRGDSQQRWQQILAVSTDLFRRKGFSGTSMQDVSDAVGLRKGSLYYYIRSKEDLLFEILKGLHKDGEEIVAAVQLHSDDPLGQLRIYIKKAAVFSGLNTERLVIFLRDFENIADEKRDQIISEREMYSQTVRRLIDEAQKLGLVSAKLDAPLAAKLLSSAITSTHEWLNPNGRRPIEDAAAEIADILVGGLITHDHKQAPPVKKRSKSKKR